MDERLEIVKWVLGTVVNENTGMKTTNSYIPRLLLPCLSQISIYLGIAKQGNVPLLTAFIKSRLNSTQSNFL
jgi:hypothetical protein